MSASGFLAECHFQFFFDAGEGSTLVVLFEIPNVFQKQYFRLFLLGYSLNVKEEVTTRIVEPLLFSCYAKGLAGKAAAKYVMVRYDGHGFTVFGDFSYVPKRDFAVVVKITYLGRFIYLACEETFTTDVISGKTKPAYACKKVDELKFGIGFDPF